MPPHNQLSECSLPFSVPGKPFRFLLTNQPSSSGFTGAEDESTRLIIKPAEYCARDQMTSIAKSNDCTTQSKLTCIHSHDQFEYAIFSLCEGIPLLRKGTLVSLFFFRMYVAQKPQPDIPSGRSRRAN